MHISEALDFTLRARGSLVPSLATVGARGLISLAQSQNEGRAYKGPWPAADRGALGSTGFIAICCRKEEEAALE